MRPLRIAVWGYIIGGFIVVAGGIASHIFGGYYWDNIVIAGALFLVAGFVFHIIDGLRSTKFGNWIKNLFSKK